MRLRQYAIPIALSYLLMFWWLVAIRVRVNLGPTAQGDLGQSSAAWFNVVLLLVVTSTWVLFALRRKK